MDQNGNIVEAYDNDQAVCVDGLGATLYQGYQGLFSGFFYGFGSYFKMFPAFGGYVLNDTCTRWGTFDNYNTVSSTYQAFSPSVIFGNLATSDRESTNADVALASRQTYTFEFYVLGRNGPDSFGGPGYYGSVDGLGPLVSARRWRTRCRRCLSVAGITPIFQWRWGSGSARRNRRERQPRQAPTG